MSVKPVKAKVPLSPATKKVIRDAAQAVNLHAVGISTGDGKAYEAWALLEIAAHFRGAGKTVYARDSQGHHTPLFRVSRGPSYLPLASDKPTDKACHFLIGDCWELHSSLRHLGKSGDNHELDVSLIQSTSADTIRNGKSAAPYDGPTFFGIELKEYSVKNTLPKGYARTLLGVAFDITPDQFMGPIEITMGGQTAHIWSPSWPWRTRYLLATTTGLTGNTKRLLQHHRITFSERADIKSGTHAFHAAIGVFLKKKV